ncbi:hypothetical protein Bbelb_157840 [Branchiostoma belcheri]|nr:hypothetical protein Bbelb_157840 [Branchiostoma belcheri]
MRDLCSICQYRQVLNKEETTYLLGGLMCIQVSAQGWREGGVMMDMDQQDLCHRTTRQGLLHKGTISPWKPPLLEHRDIVLLQSEMSVGFQDTTTEGKWDLWLVLKTLPCLSDNRPVALLLCMKEFPLMLVAESYFSQVKQAGCLGLLDQALPHEVTDP